MLYRVSGDRLSIDGREVPFVPAACQGGRIEPHLIVLHDTAGRLEAGSSVGWFKQARSKASAHFVVERDGSVTQMVDCDRCAWHAGKSAWRGRPNANGWSVGIEIVSPGLLRRRGEEGVAWFGQAWPVAELVEINSKPHGGVGLWLPYTAAQIQAVDGIIRALAMRYPTITDVAGHFQISPGRKVDVGPHFPLAEMASILSGREQLSRQVVEIVQGQLLALGYQPGAVDGIVGPRTRSAIRDFQEANGLPIDGKIDDRLRLALSRDPKGPVTGPRETVTKADVRAQSQTMQSASATKRGIEGLAALTVADALTSPVPVPAVPSDMPSAAPSGAAEAISQIDGMVTQVETARGVTGRLIGLVEWLATPAGVKFIAVSVVLTVIWFAAHRVEWRRWRDFVLGRHNGG